MLNAAQLAGQLEVSASTLTLWRQMQVGPPALMVGGRPMYLIRDVQAWLDAGGGLAYGISSPLPLRRVADDVPRALGVDRDGEQVRA